MKEVGATFAHACVRLRHMCRIGSIALCAFGLLFSSQASAADNATSDAQAAILTQLSLVKVRDLDFGKIVPGTTAGTVVLDPDGSRTIGGGVVAVSGAAQPARFSGYGVFNRRVLIRMTANSITLTRVSGTQTMVMDNFTIGSVPPTVLSTNPRMFRIAAPSGLFTFDVGGTLHVGANQAAGVYNGQFTVWIQYI